MARLDSFTRAYIETALWSTNDESTPSGGEPLDKNYSASDIAPETMSEMIADCARFQEHYGELIESDEPQKAGEREQAGHDFWLSRNGHGAGFFDGEWPVHGDELQKAAESYGEYNLYIGDDGLIYGQGPSTGQQQVVAESNRSKPTFGPTAAPGVREEARRDHFTLPVIFRAEKSGDSKGEVTAVFPTLPGTGPNDFVVYARIGQHSTGTHGWYAQTRAATPTEYTSLLAELRRAYESGPQPVKLQVVERFARSYDDERRREGVREGRHAVRDYEAVDNSGRRIAGPFKHYSDAKGPADQARGYVKYVPGVSEAGRRRPKIQHELWLCDDCTIAEVNGDYSGMDDTRAAEVASGIEKLVDEVGPLSANFDSETGDGINEFSSRTCDACRSRLAGGRHRFASFGKNHGAVREAPIPASRRKQLPPHPSVNALKIAADLSKRVGGDQPKDVPGGFRWNEQNESAQFTTFSPEHSQRVVCVVSVFNVDGSIALNFFTGEELAGQYESIGHQSYDRVDLAAMQKDVEWVWKTVDGYAASWEDGGGRDVEERSAGGVELVPFHAWKEVLAYAQTGAPLYYKAPLDRHPARLSPRTEQGQVAVYEAHARTIRIWPYGSVGRGKNRTADPFTADSGHLDRFSHPS